MSKSVEAKVLAKIKKKPRGAIFFVENFANISNTKAIHKALERLVKSEELERVATGIYVRPIIDPYIGKVLPSIEEIAVAIAKRDRAKIVPTGSYAMYKLGLTTQLPLNIVFILTHRQEKLKLENNLLCLKKQVQKLSFCWRN